MSDRMKPSLADAVRDANQTIVGLSAGPWNANGFPWPTEGYDGPLVRYDWQAHDEHPDDPFAMTGYAREDWLALADEMIARWAAWKAHIAALSHP